MKRQRSTEGRKPDCARSKRSARNRELCSFARTTTYQRVLCGLLVVNHWPNLIQLELNGMELPLHITLLIFSRGHRRGKDEGHLLSHLRHNDTWVPSVLPQEMGWHEAREEGGLRNSGSYRPVRLGAAQGGLPFSRGVATLLSVSSVYLPDRPVYLQDLI